MKSLNVSEIFYSVQGEVDVGKTSIFIRLSGCNLIKGKKACKWCDSLFAERGDVMTINDIIKEVSKYPCMNIVITGGEPLTQLDGLRSLVWRLGDLHYKICIETNGTLYDDILKYFNKVSCSPKKQLINIDVLKKLNELNSVRFKFVYEEGRRWWEEVISVTNISSSAVWIMPEGRTKREQDNKMIKVIEYCKKKGFNFTPRLQVLVWGKKRKV